jgi:hypothetical protein
MTDREKEFFPYFIYRPNMYLFGKADEATTIAFIHGVEFGQQIYENKKNHTSFSSTLSNLLENEYKIKKGSLGWSYQVEMYAKKKKIDFSEAFFELSKILFPNPPKPRGSN